MKKLLLPVLLIAGLFPLTSSAVCSQYGHIERVTAVDGVVASYYIYLRNSALRNYWWYVKTTNGEIAEIATTALTSTTRVYVRGNESTCPTTGTARKMGDLQYIIINP
jgi:hypothetical protein